MSTLDKDARIALEKNVDSVIHKPKNIERIVAVNLRMQGIEPNLETVLSFISGLLYGILDGVYILKHNRHLNNEEIQEFNTLLKRRAWEIREAFIGTRIR